MPDTTPTNRPPPPRCASCGAWWRLPLLLALVLAALVLARSRGGPDAVSAHDPSRDAPANPSGPAAPEAGDKVSLTVDFGNGRVRRFDDIAWHDGMTVADLLAAVRRAAASPSPAIAAPSPSEAAPPSPTSSPSGLTYTVQGAGSEALLTAIDGVANEGGRGRNWLFSVNDQPADRSFGAYVLRPGDRVLWRFDSTQ